MNSATPAQRAKELLAKMQFSEKMAMVHGWKGSYVGDVPRNSRLNIPSLNLEDGPQGVADGVELVTAWPSALTTVASWCVCEDRAEIRIDFYFLYFVYFSFFFFAVKILFSFSFFLSFVFAQLKFFSLFLSQPLFPF